MRVMRGKMEERKWASFKDAPFFIAGKVTTSLVRLRNVFLYPYVIIILPSTGLFLLLQRLEENSADYEDSMLDA